MPAKPWGAFARWATPHSTLSYIHYGSIKILQLKKNKLCFLFNSSLAFILGHPTLSLWTEVNAFFHFATGTITSTLECRFKLLQVCSLWLVSSIRSAVDVFLEILNRFIYSTFNVTQRPKTFNIFVKFESNRFILAARGIFTTDSILSGGLDVVNPIQNLMLIKNAFYGASEAYLQVLQTF